jgi:hypothetical protein
VQPDAQWNADTCDKLMTLFECIRRRKEDELESLIAEASRRQHGPFTEYFEKLEAMKP